MERLKMLIENSRVESILETIELLEIELKQIRGACNHIKGTAEYLHYDGEGHSHTYINYDCRLCGEWLDEEKIQ